MTGVRTGGMRRAGLDDGGDGPGGGRRGRRKGDWWRHWTWKKVCGVVAAMAGALILLAIAGVMYAYAKTQVPTAVSAAALQQSSTVYFSDGKTQVGTFVANNGINRQILQTNQIPAVMDNAMVAAEDRKFYSEGGISPTGILRAAYVDARGGDYAQGGSTLTQQFVRNYYATIGTRQTLSRKIKEIFVSIKVSHEKSKQWILTQYLDMVPMGDNAYGVAAASQTYFSEPAMNLTLSQAAMLAAMPNEPGFFNPDPSAGAAYTALVGRWHYVLTNMVRDGTITQKQADAQTFPKVISGNQLQNGWSGYKGYVMQAVQNEMWTTYHISQAQLDSEGLKIVTTVNPAMMTGLYSAVSQTEQQMQSDGSAFPSFANIGAVLEQPGTGNLLAWYGGPGYGPGHTYDMALQSRNQVGSSFKPYVLATAVSQGMDVQNSVLNGIEPMCVPPDLTLQDQMTLSAKTTNCQAGWYPVNIAGENSGPLSVPVAAAISSDPAFEDLVHRVGTQNTINMAKAFGVNTGNYPAGSGLQKKVNQVGMALGIASLTVEEQATTFATLANNGVYVTPHVIAQIAQADGSTIPLKLTHREVLTPAAAADVDFALSFDTQSGGTAFPNAVLNPERPTIGKTGTTDQAQSAFFIGAIPQYSLAVGMFTDLQTQTLNGLPDRGGNGGGFGGAWPATVWQNEMQDNFASLPVDQLATPDYTGFTKWNQVTGNTSPTPSPTANPNPSQCPPDQIMTFGQCKRVRPTPSPTPSPTPTTSFPFSTTPVSPPPTNGGGRGGG
jgi:membrane peptidoglycan carboxypeptidase